MYGPRESLGRRVAQWSGTQYRLVSYLRAKVSGRVCKWDGTFPLRLDGVLAEYRTDD
jgi:hypothetical protein